MQTNTSLDDIGILELLQHDDRPTFILANSTSPCPGYCDTQIAFRNNALDDYIQEHSDVVQFEQWAHTLSAETAQGADWAFGGRAWTCTKIQSRWNIVYCSQVQHAKAAHDGDSARKSDAPTGEVSETSKFSTSLGRKPSQVFSDSGDHRQAFAPCFPSLADGIGEPRIIDWTRYHLVNLPPYIQFIKRFDWTSTALGSMSAWPDSLRRIVVAIFSDPDPRLVLWGKDLVLLYNEAAVERIGERHPSSLGQPASESFAEMWPFVAQIVRPVLYEGKAVKVEREMYFMERNGVLEETYWSFTMSPLIGDDGHSLGVLDTFTEQTESIMSQRRREVVAHLTKQTSNITHLKHLWRAFLDGFTDCDPDIVYAAIYVADDECSSTGSTTSWKGHTRSYTLEGTVGIQAENDSMPQTFELSDAVDDSMDFGNACRRAWDDKRTVTLRSHDGSLSKDLAIVVPNRGWGDPVTNVCVMPVAGNLAFLIVALNPRRPFNEESVRFANTVRDILAKPAWIISQQRFDEIHNTMAHQLRVTTLQVAKSEEKFAKLCESSPIGICTFSPDGKSRYVNDEYLTLIGIPRSYDGKGMWEQDDWRNEVMAEDQSIISDAWHKLIERTTNSISIEFRIKRPWGSFDKATGSEIVGETWLLNIATVELDDQGNIDCIHAWLLDVSHQHHIHNLMTQRLEDALENKRQADRFIDMVSHELRNPLSAILQSADGILTVMEEDLGVDTFKKSSSREAITEAAQTICLCAQHQKCIVDDILTLSKLDSNLLVITPDKVQPPDLIGKVLKMYEAELLRTRVEARLEVAPSYNELFQNQDYVLLDPSRLLQVIINLLTNAIKFTQYMDERRITVHLEASYEPPSGELHNLIFTEPHTIRHEHSTSLSPEWGTGQDLYLHLAVQDTGRGLSEEEISLLFQRFSQASPKTYKQYGGSGLGLFISKELTELQGGRIGVSSQGVGKGSTFAFYVRARRCPPEDSASTEAPSPLALQHIWNTPVAEISAPGTPIRPSSGTSTPIWSGDTTPVLPDMTTFTEQTQAHAKRPRISRIPTKRKSSRPKPPTSGAETPTTPNERLHVLIVEDNLINQKVMAVQLRRIGCVVHIANHGLECLSFLQKTRFWRSSTSTPTPTLPLSEPPPEKTPLSIVLMDWEMPTMDGLTCVREIRRLQDEGSIVAHVPVIAVTANARGEQINVAMEAGMDDLVTKPFRIPDLVPQMEKLVRRYPLLSGVVSSDVVMGDTGLDGEV